MPTPQKYEIGDASKPVSKKLQWYYTPAFIAFWLAIYVIFVDTQIDQTPKPLTRRDGLAHPSAFIAERAQESLIGLTSLGPRVVGSAANEVGAVEFLKQQIRDIQAEASELMQLEVDVQEARGGFIFSTMLNMYQDIQNVVVKLSRKDSVNENYLLLNSHFDSVPTSPGAGDDASMVVVMLEVLRVLAKSGAELSHPIIFLFNGAEESALQASHAFITKHKWAKHCKTVINLDAAGSGGRELLFQSGPNHPWLMKYYRKVPHPFANTAGEEFFQSGSIPSDSDFRIFRDFGSVPGFDMAYIFNGYVYHTEFDNLRGSSLGSLQNTGENLLVLVKGLANAPELDNIAAQAEGHNVFYDYLGWFIIFYTDTESLIINIVVCTAALLAIATSLYFMSKRSGISWSGIALRGGIIFIVQIVSIVLACCLPLLIAVFMDGVGKSLTWFTSSWLIAGLYMFPIYFGLGILPALYLERTKNDSLQLGYRIQLFQHANCVCLILGTIILTAMGVRSSYLLMICVFFDVIALIFNLITKFHGKAHLFMIGVIICQIMPFTYMSYMAQVYLNTMIPMLGRSGSTFNPDLIVAVMAILFSLLSVGFIIPLFMMFRKTRTTMCCCLACTILFMLISLTSVGYPYRAKTSVQRFLLIHAHRRLHNPDGTVRIDESGIYIYPQDRHFNMADEFINKIGEKQPVSEHCDKEMFCGMPLYDYRWDADREHSYWVKTKEHPLIPTEYPTLKLVETTPLETQTQQRYNFTLNGPDHMNIFINVKNNAKILNWTFNETFISSQDPPYFIYFIHGLDSNTLDFSIDVEKTTSTIDTNALEIGIGGHWLHEKKRSQAFQNYIDNFPDYVFIQDWVGTYETWYF